MVEETFTTLLRDTIENHLRQARLGNIDIRYSICFKSKTKVRRFYVEAGRYIPAGKTALVTGAGGEIGYAIAEALANFHAWVLLVDKDEALLKSAEDKISAECR